MRPFVAIAASAVGLALLAGTALAQTPGAAAEVRDRAGNVVGSATFSPVPDGVRVVGTFRGLAPGQHGIHVHAVGKCEPPFTSAGGHFNPTGKKHGLRNPEGHHVGDLPNLVIGADGTGAIDAVARGATLGAAPTSLFDADGSALVIHAGPDDDVSDPAGNSGDRIACGILAQRTLGAAPTQLPRTGAPALPALLGLGGLFAVAGALMRRRGS